MTRQLPSLSALRAFEAAARFESFKQAAEELHVSPTAVSHQIKLLERDLGQRLFVRRVRQVRLTEAGRVLQAGLGEAFDRMAAATAQCRRSTERATVTVGLGPIVASKWLSPRLSRFWQRYPDIDLRLHHSPRAVDFRESDVDLMIAWGEGDWRGVEVEELLRIRVTPVFSPRLLSGGRTLESPEDLAGFALIHQRDHGAWQDWFAAAGLAPEAARRGVVIEDAHVGLQTAVAGQGVALGTLPFIDDELAAGRLVRPFDLAVEPQRAYYLVYPKAALAAAACRNLRDWLVEEAGADSQKSR
jgi:LysR family glycine cleavage system transcriptional activator